MINMTAIRAGSEADLEAVEAIQRACPEAAHWKPADYLNHDFLVATVGNRVGGFIVMRSVAPDERELLNLAVAPEYRRNGVARALWKAAVNGFTGAVYLEVRDSNQAAINFYKLLTFQEVSRRSGYYEDTGGAAIVMKFHSC